MALMPCSVCGRSISTTAVACPSCGAPHGGPAGPAVSRIFRVPLNVLATGVAWNAGVPNPYREPANSQIRQAIDAGVAGLRAAGWEPSHPVDLDFLRLHGLLVWWAGTRSGVRFDSATIQATAGQRGAVVGDLAVRDLTPTGPTLPAEARTYIAPADSETMPWGMQLALRWLILIACGIVGFVVYTSPGAVTGAGAVLVAMAIASIVWVIDRFING